MDRIIDKIMFILAIPSILVLIWLLLSWLQVLANNVDGNAVYPDYNLFVVLQKIF